MSPKHKRAAELVLAVPLPPDADPLAIERAATAKQFVEFGAFLAFLRDLLARTHDEPARANVRAMIEEGEAEFQKTGARLLQIVAASEAPVTRQ